MSTEIKTLQNPAKTKAYLPRTCIKAIADKNGQYLDEDLVKSDIDALKNGKVASMAEAITSLLTPTTIWSGDIHATGGSYTVSEAITNFMALQFVFNVIPSRSPSYDVQADQSLILPFVGRYDLSSVTGGVSAFGIEFTSTTDFTVYTYSKATSYDAGLVRIIGLFRLPQ